MLRTNHFSGLQDGQHFEQKTATLRELGLLNEYATLKQNEAISTALMPTLTTEEASRIRYIDFLCLAYELPNEIKDGVLEYYIPDLDPLDITNANNHATPAWCTSPAAAFTYWRHRRLIFRTDDLTFSNLDSKLAIAHTFIHNILFNPAHEANFPAMGQAKKKIIIEIYLRAALTYGGLPFIVLENFDPIWRLLQSLNGEIGHIRLVFMLKDDSDPNDLSAATKREITPDGSGAIATVKQNMHSILYAAMLRFKECVFCPAGTPATDKWRRYIGPMTANDPDTSDQDRLEYVLMYSSLKAQEQIYKIWSSRLKKGYMLHHMLRNFGKDFVGNSPNLKLYRDQCAIGAAEPNFPLDITPFRPVDIGTTHLGG